MPLTLVLIATAFADDFSTLAVPLPDMAAETVTETVSWDSEGEHEGPPLAWRQLGEHRIGGEHLLYDDAGQITLRCEIQSFELRSTETVGSASDGAEVWALLNCGTEAMASR
ncbi:MAG: hypothetical protein P8R54_31230 [Myxococcota bacterium]|nr:hypothetical protein [Myxococcota bacterium]